MKNNDQQQTVSPRRGRPKGKRSVHFRQSLGIAYAFHRGRLTRKEILAALGRPINPSSYNWLRTRLNYGSDAINDPANCDWLEDLYPTRLLELAPGDHKAFHIARLRRLAAYS